MMHLMNLIYSLLSSEALANRLAPTPASEIAADWDFLYIVILLVSAFFSAIVIFGMIYFAFKYKRKSDNDKTAYISHNNVLEFTWSFIPFVLFIVFFVWGWVLYHDMRDFPEGAFEVHVTGQKWNWTFEYKSGRRVTNEFVVPVNTDVKLIMTSTDVLHSFFIPSLRVKQDVIPGRYTALWFNANKEGNFQIYCTEYCGTGHSEMLAKLKVVPKKEFENWLANDPYKGLSLVDIGAKVFGGKCTACHNANREKKVGPGFAGLFGSKRNFTNASAITVDENYIRESILKPNAKIVEGYQKGLMPTFAGQVSDREIRGVIEYIKSLK